MLASDVENNKIKILEGIATRGIECEPILEKCYCYAPGEPSNAEVRAAIADLVFEQVGSFARQMMVRVIGNAGGIEDAVYLSLLLDSTERPKFDYPFKNFMIYGGRAYALDSDEKVREAAIEAIGRIISKGAGEKGSAPVNGGLGKTILRCALLDDSEKVRGTATEILWNCADKAVILTLLKELSDAEANGNLPIYARAEEAVKKAAEAMKKARVRGTAVKPLIGTALGDGNSARVASDVVVRLAGMENEVLDWLEKERAAAEMNPNLEGEEKSRKIRRLTALITRIGIASEPEELPLPKKFVGKNLDDTRKAKNLRAKGEKDEAPIRVPAGPVTEFCRRIVDRIKGRPIQK